jgi:hypothetical protein
MAKDEEPEFKRRKAPTRFVPTEQIRKKTRKPVSAATRTRMNRYDRKEIIDWDLERKKNDAMYRLLDRGVPMIQSTDEEGHTTLSPAARTLQKSREENGDPAPTLQNSQNATVAVMNWATSAEPQSRPASNLAVDPIAPAGEAGMADPHGAGAAENTPSDKTVSRHLGTEFSSVEPSVIGAAAVQERLHRERDPADLYQSGHGKKLSSKAKAGRPSNTKRGRTSRAGNAGAARKKGRSLPIEIWLPRMAAYMVAAVAVGYVLVTTVSQLYDMLR